MLVVSPERARWRKVVEGDVARDVRRRIPKTVTVDSIIASQSVK
jgi:molybdopterin-binding protein